MAKKVVRRRAFGVSSRAVRKGTVMGLFLGTVFGLLLGLSYLSSGKTYVRSQMDPIQAFIALVGGTGASGMLAGVMAGLVNDRLTAMVIGAVVALPATIAGSLMTYRPDELRQAGAIAVVIFSTIVIGSIGGFAVWTDYQRDRDWWSS